MRTLAPTQNSLFQGGQGIVNTPPWIQYFQQVFDYYTLALRWIDPGAVEFGQHEPPVKVVGLLAYADGVNWSPDSSGVAGFYEWDGTAWVFIGGSIGGSPLSPILYDLAGSGRKFYIEGINIVMGTDENENPKEYFSPVVKEL
jgi:hypothetical protein